MRNSNTKLNSLIRVEKFSETAQSQTFLADLQHRLCGGRAICSTAKFAPSITMSYKVISVTSVGLSTYSVLIQYTGVLSYLPYTRNTCNPCPRTETLFGFLTVPVYATGTAPTTSTVSIDSTDATPVVTPLVDDCSILTNDVLVSAAFTVNS